MVPELDPLLECAGKFLRRAEHAVFQAPPLQLGELSSQLIHEAQAGVKCSTNRGWASSQRCTAGALRVERLSQIT